MSAEWRPVEGFEGYYEVCSDGQVRSAMRRQGSKGAVLKAGTNKAGYKLVSLWRDGKGRSCNVHRLVAAAFLGPCPPGMEVRHMDGDPANNVLTNLRYGTSSENNDDIVRHGRHHWRNKAECPQGHPYSAQNTYHEPASGYRRCRTCLGLRLIEAEVVE
jgi:hypothetical protein